MVGGTGNGCFLINGTTAQSIVTRRANPTRYFFFSLPSISAAAVLRPPWLCSICPAPVAPAQHRSRTHHSSAAAADRSPVRILSGHASGRRRTEEAKPFDSRYSGSTHPAYYSTTRTRAGADPLERLPVRFAGTSHLTDPSSRRRLWCMIGRSHSDAGAGFGAAPAPVLPGHVVSPLPNAHQPSVRACPTSIRAASLRSEAAACRCDTSRQSVGSAVTQNIHACAIHP